MNHFENESLGDFNETGKNFDVPITLKILLLG